jgi:hypothetical protein
VVSLLRPNLLFPSDIKIIRTNLVARVLGNPAVSELILRWTCRRDSVLGESTPAAT